MRKLIMKMSMSLDGFVSDTVGKNDWVFKTGDQDSLAWAVGLTWESGLIIMGRKSFETMNHYWPTAPGPYAAPMNEIPKAVFTKAGFKVSTQGNTKTGEQTPAEASWSTPQILDGDLAEEITKLKAQPGKPILAIGGAGFMRDLIATGLIDEFHLSIHPVILGSGNSIFTDVTIPLYLKLADVKSFPGGVVAHIYRQA